MKRKVIIIIASILQFLSVLSFIAIIKMAIAWKQSGATGTMFALVLTVGVIFYLISVFLKKKYPAEYEVAEGTMQKHRFNYWWAILIMVAVAILAPIIFIPLFELK